MAEIDVQCDSTERHLMWSTMLVAITELFPDYNSEEHWNYFKSWGFKTPYFGPAVVSTNKKKHSAKTKPALAPAPASAPAVAVKEEPSVKIETHVADTPFSAEGGVKRKIDDVAVESTE